MEELTICVNYRGQTKCFPCTFSTFGFSYRFTVKVFDTNVIFEPDEERNLRARIEDPINLNKELKALIPLIGVELQNQLNSN